MQTQSDWFVQELMSAGVQQFVLLDLVEGGSPTSSQKEVRVHSAAAVAADRASLCSHEAHRDPDALTLSLCDVIRPREGKPL